MFNHIRSGLLAPALAQGSAAHRWVLRGAVLKPSIPMSNYVLNWTCGDMLRSNRPLLAAGQLARR